ncbi:MAG: hypothetical protein KA140_03305 [Caldisericia bacterium]|nr:hypothetical protein [Caldisericia bacterium]
MGLISLMIVMLLVTGWFKRDTGDSSAFDYAPVKNTSIATFDLGMNMGDLIDTIANVAGQGNSENSMMAKSVLENIPDLSFLDVKGFALLDQKNSSDFIVGLRYSGRSDPKQSLDQMLSKISAIGIEYQEDDAGFINIGEGNDSTSTLYLDDNHLLIAQNRQFLEECLQTKHNQSQSIRSHSKWSKIEGMVSGKPISYCGIFDLNGKEAVVVGVVQNLSNEVNFKVSWLDGVDQVNELVGDEIPFDLNLADLFKWQKNLSAAISSTPDGTVRFALPFAVTSIMSPKFEEGETSGFINIEDLSGSQNYGIRIKADKEKLGSFVESFLNSQGKITPENDGIMRVEPVSTISIPSMAEKPETNTNISAINPNLKESPLITDRNLMSKPLSGEYFYKLDGDTLFVGNNKENLVWKPGRDESVTGSILSLVIDGKAIIKNLSGLLSLYADSLPNATGITNEKLFEILDKMDFKFNIDLLTSDKDLSCSISIKYNLENALK